jgi:hypothetical protein
MKDLITRILTDATIRNSANVEAALLEQAVATPWVTAQNN